MKKLRRLVVVPTVCAALLTGAGGALLGTCGPFTDTASDSFCAFVLEVFYLGITTGTTATTYDPTANVTRLQMAAFLSRSVDSTLKRASRRAIRNQLWTTQNPGVLGVTSIGSSRHIQFDGADLWLASNSGTVKRVRASDARLLETWTGASSAFGLTIGSNRILVTGQLSPAGALYAIDPSQPAGAVTTVASNLGNSSTGVAYDGARVWTANPGSPGSVSIVTPTAGIPWTVTTFPVGIGSTAPFGALFDGSNVWVTDTGLGTLLKLDAAGAVNQTVTVGTQPFFPGFDGNSIWVPNIASNTVTVVRASNGAVLQTLTGNGLNGPGMAAFDGERVVITNTSAPSISLWKAADLTPLGTIPAPAASGPQGVCSDGAHFWVTDFVTGKLIRY